jgi:PAS domain S-box-containing protein
MGRTAIDSGHPNPADLARVNATLREEIERRSRIETALRGSEEKYRTLVETTNTGYLIIDGDGAILDANAEYVRISGHDRLEDILGRRVTEWTAPYDLERNAREVEKCARLGYVRNLEIDYTDRAGRITPIEINATVIQTPDGTRILSLCRDITQRRQAEAALRQAELQNSYLIESVQAIVWRADPGSLCFTFVSPEAEALLGYPVERWIQDADFWPSHIHPDDRAAAVAFCVQSTAEGQDHTIEYRMIAADGRIVWLRDIVRVLMQEGRPSELVGLMVDVTDRRTAEDRIRNLNQTLELRVRERTAELQAAIGELQSFSYSVSHDLRAPLRAIDGYCRTLAETCAPCLDETGRGMLERVRANAVHMAELIDGLLTLSRLSRDELRIEDVDLSEMGRSILSELEHADPERIVETRIAPSMRVRGDPRLLRLMLENLLNNAWKFTRGTEGARIEFGLDSGGTDAGEDRPDFFVRDNGVGFDMRYADKLFRAFERLHGQAEFPGTGIGLATAARILQRHGGGIRVEGVVGKGATFRFTLGGSP